MTTLTNKLFVSGFGYTGSGFVLDWLREQGEIATAPVRPFKYYRHQGFMTKPQKSNISVQILQAVMAESVPEKRRLLNELRSIVVSSAEYHESLPNRGGVPSRRYETQFPAESVFGRASHNFSNPEIKSRRSSPHEVLFDLPYVNTHLKHLDAKDFNEKHHWNSWLEHKLHRFWSDKSIIAFDKSLPLDARYFEPFLHLFCPAKALIVVRNPADAIIDAYRNLYLKKRRGTPPEKPSSQWGRRLQRRMRVGADNLVLAQGYAQKYPENVRLVSFERFVLNHTEEAKELAGWMNFVPKLENYSHLDLSKSAKNIDLGGRYPLLDKLVREHQYYAAWDAYVRNSS